MGKVLSKNLKNLTLNCGTFAHHEKSYYTIILIRCIITWRLSKNG